jgi:hypothetical protein
VKHRYRQWIWDAIHFLEFPAYGDRRAARYKFEPGDGEVGAEVKITGRNLQLATGVTFNGTPAKFTQQYPSTDIIAIVPDLATTGPIEVVTPVGTAASARSFTVVP